MTKLAKLENIENLRVVWPHEASDFTPWLAEDDNITLLADAIGLDITVDECESSVGDFHVDILATETGTNRKIIIENQLEDTNHDHLGKLITYAAGKNASIIIWVVKRAREEHRAAIEWLNAQTSDEIGFFLCEIKLFRINDSDPAVKFEVIEQPNGWSKEMKKKDGEVRQLQQNRYDYWTLFEEKAFNNPEFARCFRYRKPSYDHWMDFSIGSSACHLAALQLKKHNSIGVELYINNDKSLFHSLHENRTAIEAETGLTFHWNELPHRKASRIIASIPADSTDRSDWENQFAWLQDTLLKMYTTFRKYLS